jgi:hypothetical protein
MKGLNSSHYEYKFDEEAEKAELIQSTKEIYKRKLTDYNEAGVAQIQTKWMSKRTGLMKKYGFLNENNEVLSNITFDEATISAMVDDFNHELNAFQEELREALGVENYKKLNGGEDVIYTLIDLETAKTFYLPE